MDKDRLVSIETINAQFDVSVGTVHNYSRETADAEDLREVCPKGAQRRSERKTLSWQQGDGRANQSRSFWCSGDLWWKLDLLLWPRDQETEFPVEACWLSQTQEGQTEQIHPQTFDDPLFWQHWHDLHGLGSHWTDSQQGILCWIFKGVHDEIQSEEASTRTMHQSTTSSLSQTIWPRWASRQFVSLPIVQTLLPVTFGYSLSSRKNLEVVVMRQLRRWKRLWRRSLTRSHKKRTSMGPSRSCWNSTSALQPEEISSKGTRVSCVCYKKKCPYEKKSLETCWRHLVYIQNISFVRIILKIR